MKSLTEIYQTDEVYIIGGGPSAEEVDWSLLRDKCTIGCNRSALDANTDILFSLDSTFMGRFCREMNYYYDGLICLALSTEDQFKHWPFCDRQYIHERGKNGLSETIPNIRGRNSGHGAVNLALIEGFKTIHLIGFDMRDTGHWHSGYDWSRQTRKNFEIWARDLNEAKHTLDVNNVTIYNYSLSSAVTVYPFRSLYDL